MLESNPGPLASQAPALTTRPCLLRQLDIHVGLLNVSDFGARRDGTHRGRRVQVRRLDRKVTDAGEQDHP